MPSCAVPGAAALSPPSLACQECLCQWPAASAGPVHTVLHAAATDGPYCGPCRHFCLSFPHSARSCCGFPFSLVHLSFATPGLMLLLLLFLQEAPEDSRPLSSGVLWHLGVAHCLFFLCKVGFGICRVAPACVRGRCSPAEMLGVCGPAEGLGVCLHSAPPSMKSVTSCPPRPSIPRAAPWCRRPTHCWESGR